jgi:hypothetical protein
VDDANTSCLLHFDNIEGLGTDAVGSNFFWDYGSPTQSSDTPTNVCCNFSPLIVSDLSFTLSEGNRKVVVSNDSAVRGSMALPTSGKYYFEVECVNDNTFGLVGFMRADKVYDKVTSGRASQTAGLGGYDWDDDLGLFRRETTTAYTGSTWTTGDILGFYIDYDNDAIWASKNGTLENGASQSEVEAGTTTNAIWTGTLATDGSVVPYVGCNGGSNMTFKINCGQEPFNTSLYAGYRDLSSTSFYTNAAPAIEDGTAHFDVHTRTGTGAEEAVTAFSFAPSLSYIKKRNGLSNWLFNDLVRGAQLELYGNLNNAETPQTQGIKTFDANGYTLGTAGDYNNLNDTFVDYAWKGDGTSGSSNTDGSISSTVNVNDTAGFSIVKYTSTNGSGAGTVGHGQTGALDLIIVKNLDSTDNWAVYHSGNTSAPETDYLILNLPNATADSNTFWNDTAPSSASPFVFSVGTAGAVNDQGAATDHIAYCFRAIPGYSSFGSYEGNSLSDGSLVLLDFAPAFVMAKCINTAGTQWVVHDNKRPLYNDGSSARYRLYADADSIENTTANWVDFLSNGFKWRLSSQDSNNSSNGTYIYAAFAENPFAGSSPATAR